MPRYDVACQRILRGIGDRERIRSIIRRAALTRTEACVMELRYVDRVEDLQTIADRIGYSYSKVSKAHTSAAKKVLQLLI